MKNAKEFTQYLVVDCGYQDITVKGYLGSAKRFTRVAGLYPAIEKAKAYMEVMYTSKYSFSHKINTALGVEQYMKFIGNPVRFGRQKKPRHIIKEVLTEGEVTAMILVTKNLKQKAAVALLAYSGIRNKEFCGLRARDIEYTTNRVNVIQGKGLKDRVADITPECTKVLIEYIKQYEKKPDDFLFTTYQGNQFTGGALRKLVKVLGKKAKIAKRIYPHILRHSMSVNMLTRSADIETIRKQLGHVWLETTCLYCSSIVLLDRNNYQKSAPSYL